MSTVIEEEPAAESGKLSCNKTVRQSVFEVLTCPICHEYMSPPITLCQAGHNICNRCRPNLQFKGGNKCPRCRKDLLDTRNVALETIARGLKYPCRYDGCRFKSTMEEIGKHHARCNFRSYDCPIRTQEHCYWNGKLPEVRDHVTQKHPTATLAITSEREGEVNWEISNAECYQNSHQVVFAFDHVFVFHKRFDIPQRKLCLAVQQWWDSADEPIVFRYELHMDKNSGKQTAVLSSTVHAESEDIDQVFVAGESLRVDFDMLMNFVRGTRNLRLRAISTNVLMD